MKKSILKSEAESNELSNLLTRERLEKAGFTASKDPANDDPDRDAIYDRVRSAKKAANKKGISKKMLRKLAGI